MCRDSHCVFMVSNVDQVFMFAVALGSVVVTVTAIQLLLQQREAYSDTTHDLHVLMLSVFIIEVGALPCLAHDGASNAVATVIFLALLGD